MERAPYEYPPRSISEQGQQRDFAKDCPATIKIAHGRPAQLFVDGCNFASGGGKFLMRLRDQLLRLGELRRQVLDDPQQRGVLPLQGRRSDARWRLAPFFLQFRPECEQLRFRDLAISGPEGTPLRLPLPGDLDLDHAVEETLLVRIKIGSNGLQQKDIWKMLRHNKEYFLYRPRTNPNWVSFGLVRVIARGCPGNGGEVARAAICVSPSK